VEKVLMSGAQILAETAVRAGCRYYFGYPITPQNEVPEYLSWRLPQEGGVFVQAESELAAINMVMGAAMAGARVMTSSSGPGVSLMQEGISYLAGQELPAVIADFMRGGPGLGNIAPAQGDYFQATRCGGHGGYRCMVLAPASVQELSGFTSLAFELADKYRNPVIILADGLQGQMMEPAVLPEPVDPSALPSKPWAVSGSKGRQPKLIRSMYLPPRELEAHNYKLLRKYDAITRLEVDFETHHLEGAQMLVAAYGSAARIALSAVERMRERGLAVGLFRPKTLWPFPSEALFNLADRIKHFLVVELSNGQMLEDVRLAVEGQAKVHFYGRPGGVVPTPDEVAHQISHQFHLTGLIKAPPLV
jgi:2-oxoglutarate ferredoxin oxidoreductase subunit alpha